VISAACLCKRSLEAPPTDPVTRVTGPVAVIRAAVARDESRRAVLRCRVKRPPGTVAAQALAATCPGAFGGA